MAKKSKLPSKTIDDSAIPYRVVVDFLEGTLRKQDAIAFARGFIERHFDAQSDSGYYVAPYVGGYIFEVQEGGQGRAYLPGILSALDENQSASACIQMARRVLEIKKSNTGNYTSILLPEGTEPQNPDKVFPEPGPKLIPFKRSGLAALIVGASIFGSGLLFLLLATVVYLVEVSGLLSPPMRTIDYSSLPLSQWQTLTNVAGEKSSNYVKTIRFRDGKWNATTAERQAADFDTSAPPAPGTMPAPSVPAINPLAPPGAAAAAPVAGGSATTPGAPENLPAPPVAAPQ